MMCQILRKEFLKPPQVQVGLNLRDANVHRSYIDQLKNNMLLRKHDQFYSSAINGIRIKIN